MYPEVCFSRFLGGGQRLSNCVEFADLQRFVKVGVRYGVQARDVQNSKKM